MDSHDMERLGSVIGRAIYDGIEAARVQAEIARAQGQPESDRAAKLARIDATARAIWACQFMPDGTGSTATRNFYPSPGFNDALEADCAAAYRFALALERAREAAIKEIT